MAAIPVLLTPKNNGTVWELPYFELYVITPYASTETVFEIEIVDVVNPNTIINIYSDTLGWNKESYISGEIAVYELSAENTLIAGRQYKWRARSNDGASWSDFSGYYYFNTLLYVGDSDLGIFTVASDAADAMVPHLISVGDSYPPNSDNIGDEAVITNRIPVFKWDIPYGLGEGIHFRLELDVVEDMTSRNILRYESKYNAELFKMYDGIQWLDFPETGTIVSATQVKIVLPDTFFNDKYFWKVIPAI